MTGCLSKWLAGRARLCLSLSVLGESYISYSCNAYRLISWCRISVSESEAAERPEGLEADMEMEVFVDA